MYLFNRHLNANEKHKRTGSSVDAVKIRKKRGDADVTIAEYLAWMQMNMLDKERIFTNCSRPGCGIIDVIDVDM